MADAAPPEATPVDVEAEIDRLYRLPLAEFVAARNELAGRLRQAGERDAAARAKALPRPSATAWAVNRLHWERPGLLSELRAAGDALRRAHEGLGEVGAAGRERREAVAVALRAALEALSESGGAASLAAERRIRGSLEALAAGVGAPGRLARDLDPPSFDAISELAPVVASPAVPPGAAPPAPASVDAAAHQAADQAARDALALAEAERERLRRAAERAAEGERASRVRAEAAEAEIAEAEVRLERARSRARAAVEERVAAEAEAADARERLERAAAAAEAARRRVGDA